jgi:hypothetical protein
MLISHNMRRVSHEAPLRGCGRSEIRYFDDDQNPVSRDKAKWAVVRELDENGNLVIELEGFID